MTNKIVQVYGIPGYGHWANTTDPDVGPEHDVILGWNEPNQADQANRRPARPGQGRRERKEEENTTK